jgi:hypothetical protein
MTKKKLITIIILTPIILFLIWYGYTQSDSSTSPTSSLTDTPPSPTISYRPYTTPIILNPESSNNFVISYKQQDDVYYIDINQAPYTKILAEAENRF